MARASTVTPSLDSNIECENEYDDNEEYDYENDIASLNKKSELVLHALRKNKIACSNFVEILASAIESKKLLEEQEETIDMLQK